MITRLHPKKHILFLTVGGILAILWSWLLFVDVAVLSSSLFIGRLVSIISFFVIWGVSFAIFWRFVAYMKKYPVASWKTVLGVILSWATIEFLVSWIITAVWMGRDGSIDSVLPFGSLTPILMYTPLAFLTRLVGYHGLSAIFVGGVWIFLRKDLSSYRKPFTGIVTVLTFFCWATFTQANGQTITATIMAEDLETKQIVDQRQSDLVVFPEYGLDDYTSETISLRFANNKPVDFIGSQQRSDSNSKIHNVFIHGTIEEGFILEEDKTRLIPGGEYLPYTVELLLKKWPDGEEALKDFAINREVVKGSSTLTPAQLSNGMTVGGAVCSSIISPKDYRYLTRSGAELLTNSASLEIFNGSPIFHMQHRSLAAFMAIANARPFLQSSNSGAAFALDHNGRSLASIDPIAYTEVDVQTNHKTTPYSLAGEWMATLGGILLLFAGSSKIIKNIKGKALASKK